MYKNFLIVASKIDTAGINITTQMSQFGNFNFYLVEGFQMGMSGGNYVIPIR